MKKYVGFISSIILFVVSFWVGSWVWYFYGTSTEWYGFPLFMTICVGIFAAVVNLCYWAFQATPK